MMNSKMAERAGFNLIEVRILDYLKENPSGSTITDISKDLDLHRNTVSKYISKLDQDNYIKIKKLGRYKMCYSAEKGTLPKKTFIRIYKGILHGLKKHFPNKEEVFKQIGTELIDYYPPETGNLSNVIKELKKDFSLKTIVEVIEDIYHGIFQDSITIQKIDISKEDKSIKIRYANSTFLKDSDDYIYHAYMLIGYIEVLMIKVFKRPYVVSIEDFNVSDDKKEAYVNILIQIIRD